MPTYARSSSRRPPNTYSRSTGRTSPARSRRSTARCKRRALRSPELPMCAPCPKERAVRTRSATLSALALLVAVPAAAQANGPPRLRVENPAALAKERRAAAAGEAPGPSAPATSPQQGTFASGGLNKPGLGAGDNASADQGSPPDTTGAIGPAHYMEVVNSRVAAYSRATLGQIGSSVALGAFVGAPGDFVFDPQIQWD